MAAASCSADNGVTPRCIRRDEAREESVQPGALFLGERRGLRDQLDDRLRRSLVHVMRRSASAHALMRIDLMPLGETRRTSPRATARCAI